MRWPWQREKREANSYTEARVMASLADAECTSKTAHETSALEAAAGLYAACLAGAVVTPSLPPLNPACLSLIGRDLIRSGESLHLIRLDGDMLKLVPCASWDVRGGIAPESWFYRVDTWGPTATSPTSQIVSGAASPACPLFDQSGASLVRHRPVGVGARVRQTGGRPGVHNGRGSFRAVRLYPADSK